MSNIAVAADKPNIIIFLADDLGYADIGVNGCKDVPTPNIDSIAQNGVRFTDGYAMHCVCSPSRAGLMSGMYPHRFGFEHNSGPERFADPNFGMPRDIPCLAEKLQTAGYATGMIGKWHIGFKEGLRPLERGFDYHFGFLSGAHSYLPDRQDNDPVVRNGQPVKTTKYLTDEFAEEAVGFLDRSKGSPFFLYFPFNAVHSPMDPNAYSDRFPNLNGKRRIFAGMLTALDTAVGRVLNKVRELGQEENTLIAFYSDNGGPTADNGSLNTPLRGFKAQFFEGGIRVPFLIQWKGVIPSGQTYREMVAGFDVHATALSASGLLVAERREPPGNATPEGSRPTATIAQSISLDGVNLIPFLTQQSSAKPHDRLFWRAGAQHAARVGDWKLVDGRTEEPMLFNLRDDISEQNNLAASNPQKLKELQAAFAEWEKGTQPAKWVRQDQRNAEAGGKGKTNAENTPPTRRGAAASRVEEAFKAADKNNDGKLTREEYPQKEIFDAVDANKDGHATSDEVRTYYQQRRAQPAVKTKE